MKSYYAANPLLWPTAEARRAEYAEDDRNPRRAFMLLHQYGITPDEYLDLRERQSNACAICGGECPTGRRLGVDHDHFTGGVRGLLCTRCNTLIGLALESETILEVAAAYLRAGGQ